MSTTPFADSWARIEAAAAENAAPVAQSSAAASAAILAKTADYRDGEQARLCGTLLDEYAQDPLGDGRSLPPEVLAAHSSNMLATPGAFSVLAWVDGEPAGLCNCFAGFSTFKGKPLINVHDCFVRSAFRGKGVCGRMLAEVERVAAERGCCKVTLEVLSENTAAQRAYRRFGFEPYQLDPSAGQAHFWQKTLFVLGGAASAPVRVGVD